MNTSLSCSVKYLTVPNKNLLSNRRERMIGELAALGAALSWTVSAVLYKKALTEAKPISANIVRCASTGLILLIFLVVSGKLEFLTSLPAYAIVLAGVSGIIGLGFGDTLYMASLKLIGVAKAVPLTCTYPLFNLLWAVFLIGESITPFLILGAVAIVFGIWLLGHEKKTAVTEKRILIKGMAYALATAILWSISIAMIDMAVTLPETSSLDYALAVNATRVMAIALLLLVSAPLTDRNLSFTKLSRKTFATLILGGIVALGLGWFFLTFSLQNTPGARAIPISSATPLFSALSAFIFLHEKMKVKNVFGSIIIVVGIFLIFIV
jgi:DME family drug/metabolite transporter